MVGVGGGGLNVNVGRLDGVGGGSGVTVCDGDGCARDRGGDEAGAGGAALLLAVAVPLTAGCALPGAPPDGPVLPGSAALVAAPGVWLACPDLAGAAAQAGAGPPAGTGHQQRPERVLQPAAGLGGQVVRLVPRHAEHGGQVGALQVVPQVQLDDLAFGRVQAVQGGADELAQFGLIGGGP